MSTPIQWVKRIGPSGPYLFGKSPYGAWDGDGHGNEWECGYAIRAYAHWESRASDDNNLQFAVYEDDGAGNGNFVADTMDIFEAMDHAQKHADELAAITVSTKVAGG